MNLPSRKVEFGELLKVHELMRSRFPHDYLDEGLGVIGLFLYEPPKNAGYPVTPLNSVTFGAIGVDGIHFSSLTHRATVEPEAPVVMSIPMALDTANFIVGESLHDFLCLGCRHGFSELGNLHLDRERVLEHYEREPGGFFDDRASSILQGLSDELMLVPWSDVRGRFATLQSRYLPSLQMPNSSR